MTEKIEWYKEVLELEPNSKVFFPLARLLAEEQRFDEAVEVLEHGLERHSEFLEARLFFIELLFKTGRRTACTDQINKLSKMFAEYAGFWQAWAACLSSSGNSPDTAAVLRFLAANFMRGPVSLHDILDRGIASLLDAPVDAAATPAASEALPPSASKQAPTVWAEEHTAESGVGKTPIETTPATASDEPEPPLLLLPEEDELASHVHSLDFSADLDAAIADDANFAGDGEAPFDPDAAMADEASLSEAAAGNEPQSGDAETEAGQPAKIPDDVAAHAEAEEKAVVAAPEDGEDAEERFSLRTRSMAEVLAEQGDIKGALDIYHELAAAAVSPEENADLQQRIATLSVRLGNAQEMEGEQSPAQPESASGKDKLISMLEALAERVEARAQS